MKQMVKRIGTLWIAAILAVALVPASVFATAGATPPAGDGSKENPYQIVTAADFDLIRQNLGAHFMLADDITLTDAVSPIQGPFTGVLDGAGHSISGLKIVEESQATLFGTLKGTVQNLVFKSPTIGGTSFAAVVAVTNEGTISNVNIEGGTVSAPGGTAGALAAQQLNAGTKIEKCGSTATVTGAVAGGLVGQIENGSLTNSFAGGATAADKTAKNAKIGAVFGSSIKMFAAENVVFLQTSKNTAAGNKIQIDANTSKETVTAYPSSPNIVGVLPGVPAALQQGDKADKAPFTYTGAAAKLSHVSYASSAPGTLKVAEDGGYEALAAGRAEYILRVKYGSYTYDMRTTVMISAVAGGSASSSQSDSVSDASSTPPASSESASDAASSASSSTASSSTDASSAASDAASSATSDGTASSTASSATSDAASDSTASSSPQDGASSSSDQSVSGGDASQSGSGSGSGSDSAIPEEPTDEDPAPPTPEDIQLGSWRNENGKLYYTLKDGKKAIGPQVIDDLYYIFDDNGAVYRYQYFYDGCWYLADETGALYRNCFLASGGTRTFYDTKGAAATGWLDGPDGERYYQRVSDTIGFSLATGVYKVPGESTYLFDKNGVRNSGNGWAEGVYLENGVVSIGKKTIDGKTYIFKEDGKPATGEFTYGSASYCADETGALYLDAFRTMTDGTLRYYNGEGQAKSGWIDRADGARYYQGPDLKILTGRQAVSGVIYFFGSDGKLTTTDGWAGDYYVKGGQATVGMLELEGKTYYFGQEGLLVRGAFQFNGKKYCGGPDGALYKNDVADNGDGTRSYYNESGVAVPGVVTLESGENAGQYYQLPTLVLAVGKQTVNNELHFYMADGKRLSGDGWAGNYYVQNGKMLANTKAAIGEGEAAGTYVFSAEGAVYKNEFTWNGGTYCADATGKLYLDTIRTLANGTLRYYNSDGQAKPGWIETRPEGKYYQTQGLTLLTGKQALDNKTYYFGDTGLMISAGWVGGVYVKDGMPAQGPMTVDGKQYIFSDTGIPFKYTFTYDKNRYLASGTGVLYTNSFLTAEGVTTYYGLNGAAPVGWITLGSGESIRKYYQTPEYKILTGQQKIKDEQGKEHLYFFGSDGKLSTTDGWAGDYYVVKGAALTGMQTLTGTDGKEHQYFFSDEGLLQRGDITFERAVYFADENGILQKDATCKRADGTLRYYDENGKAVTHGVFYRGENNDEYYQGEDMVLAVGKKTVENEIRFYDADGKRKTTDGWAGDYYVQNKVALVGWHDDLEGKGPYVFNAEGAVYKGDFTFGDDGAAYYGDPETGLLLKNGIHPTADGSRYHGEDGKAPANAWVTLDGAQYYQNDKMLLVTGRQTVPVQDDTTGATALYYFAADGKLITDTGWSDGYYLQGGKVLTGAQTIEEKLYIFDDDGLVQKDSFQYKGVWYCADDKGVLYTNVIRTLADGKMRYFDEAGAAPANAWVKLGEDNYYQGADANLLTGRQTIGDKVYFFAADGKQQTGNGWVEDFYLKDGVPLVGKQTLDDGKTYIFDDAGHVQKGEFTYVGENYWADEAGALHLDAVLLRANGTRAYFSITGEAPLGWATSAAGAKYYQNKTDAGYVLATGIAQVEQDTYYFMEGGKLFAGYAENWYLINGKQYWIRSDGRVCLAPTITAVKTAHDSAKKLYSITIESAVSNAAGLHPAGSFSFDGGKTWKTSNVLTVDEKTGITLGAGSIRVRDGVGQIVQHMQTVYLAPIVIIPGGSGVSGPGSYGIDVSMYNGAINWQQVKASGIKFAIIRATSANNSGYYVDPYFESNVRNAKAAGIDVGAYIYSYARSYQDVKDEVNLFVRAAQNLRNSGITFDYPVYVDYEDKLNLQGTSYDQRTDFVRQMMVQLKGAGYYPGFYTYKSYCSYFNVGQLTREGYDFWYARYPANPYPPNNPSGDVGANVSIWQYCSDGVTNPAMQPRVNGVSTSLDLNYVYDDVPTRVHKFYGTGSTTTKPNAPESVVSPNVLSVYDVNTGRIVTDNAASILAAVVQTEVGGFNNAEVYKAQAVAAHSYIMYQAQRGGTPNVALSTPSAAVRNAVNEVADRIVTYNGVVANTMYGAANSGKTYNPEGMWGGSYPYLVAGIDSPDSIATAWQNRSNTIGLERMKSNIEKMIPGSTSGRTDYQNWLTNPEYDGNGYLTYITVMGQRVKAGKFYDNCWGLYSPNFTMRYNGNGTWTFVTRGNGHCVGMSQWGAYGLATQGYNYTQILGRYFPGTQITKMG